jgi:hypothetical protein
MEPELSAMENFFSAKPPARDGVHNTMRRNSTIGHLSPIEFKQKAGLA